MSQTDINTLLDTREPGDTVRIESEFTTADPFSSTTSLFDPNDTNIIIEDPEGNELKNTDMVQHATGQYFYDWVSPSIAGDYKIIIKATIGTDPNEETEKSIGYVRLRE